MLNKIAVNKAKFSGHNSTYLASPSGKWFDWKTALKFNTLAETTWISSKAFRWEVP